METPQIREFLAEHLAYFEAHESKFNILLGLALRIEKSRKLAKTHRLFSFGRPGAAALQGEGRNLVLGDLGPEECARLASHYSNIPYPGVVAPDEVGDWFTQAAGPERFLPPVEMAVLELRGRPKKPPVPGSHAKADDTYLLIKWLGAFHLEAMGEELAHNDLFQRAENGKFYFWCVEGEPVAVAGVVRQGVKSATIGAVYVPPESRGNRYGEAITAALADEILAGGKEYSSLFVDLKNPASQKIYDRIGYRPVSRSKTFRRKP